MNIRNANCAEESVNALKAFAEYIENRDITDEEYAECEPRITLAYGDEAVSLPNLAQTYNAFADAIALMIADITQAGI